MEGKPVRARFQGRQPERGAAAVEFGLVLIPFLLLVFGIIQYGFLFYSYQGGSDVAREAARRAAVSDPVPCHTTASPAVVGFVEATRSEFSSRTLLSSGRLPYLQQGQQQRPRRGRRRHGEGSVHESQPAPSVHSHASWGPAHDSGDRSGGARGPTLRRETADVLANGGPDTV